MRPRKQLKASRCSFTLEGDLKAQAEARAVALGMDFSPYVATLVRNDLIRPDADLLVRAEKRKPQRPVA